MNKKRVLTVVLSLVMLISLAASVQLPSSAMVTLYEPLLTRSLANTNSGYGSRTDPITGATSSFHYGIDLASAYGTPVHAAYDGVVKYAAWKDSYGYITIVYHAALGIYTFYCHLSSFNTSAGATVSAGQTIAYVGSTGDSTGNHLHFGMCTWLENYWPRSYVNPTPGVNYNYTYDLSLVGGTSTATPSVSTGEVPSSKIVSAFASSSALTQLNSIKSKYPSGSYFSDSGTACASHDSCSYDGSCSCTSFNSGIQSKGFVGYVYYCMFGKAFPTYATLPTAVDDLTKNVILRDFTPGSNGGSTVSGMFERKAQLGDIVIGEMESGTRQCMVVVDFNSDHITLYACNTVENNCLISEYSLSWSAFAATYPTMISIYRDRTDSSKYTYPEIVMSGNVAVTGVTISPSTVSLAVGQTATVTTAVLPANATNKTASWSTSNGSVATVYNNVITANGVGTATLTLTSADGAKTATCTVTVVAAGSQDKPATTLPAMSSDLTSNLVTPFTYSSLSQQLAAVKQKYPAGSSTFSYSCDNGTGSWGFVSYVSYCLYGIVYPSTTTATVPTSNWNATADSTITLVSSSEWSRVGAIQSGDLANATAKLVPAAAVGGYFYRNALPGDVLLLKRSTGYTYVALVEDFDAYGITLYTCNIPTYSPSNAVNSLEFTWQGFIDAFSGLIQIYRPSDARKYYYANEPTHIAAMDEGTFLLGNSSLNTEPEYVADYNGVLSTQFSTKGYSYPSSEAVDLGTLTLDVGATGTVSFDVANNAFAKNSYNYLTGLDARAHMTLSSNAAQITRLDFDNSSSVSELCHVTLTIQGVSALNSSTVYVTNSYGNLGKLTLKVNGGSVAVTGVSLNKNTMAMAVGTSQTLTATVQPTTASNKAVSWTSSNTSVATVSGGVVTAVGAGTAGITVTTADGAKTATCTVTVTSQTVAATGVSLNTASHSMTVGDTYTLQASVSPSNATNPNVSWSSSKTSVATVSGGVVTAVGAGTAVITVTTVDGTKTANCTLTVSAAAATVSGITLSNRICGVAVGKTYTLSASLAPSGISGTVVWSTANSNIATVSGGVVTGVSAGVTTVTASCGSYSVSATVKVHNVCSTSSPRRILDVSYYQGNIDWAAVKAAGYDGAMLRLGVTGYGSRTPVLDTKFEQNVQNATAAGVDLGVYYFSVAMNATEADRESAFVISTLSQYPGVFAYPIAYDFEWTNRGYNSDGSSYIQNTAYPSGGQTTLGKATASALINRFCDAVENAGYYVTIYTYKSFFDNYIDESAISSIDHWVAQYASSCTYTGASYGMWQYTSTNSVSGISGNVDTNYCYYNYPSIIINGGFNGFDNSAISSGTSAPVAVTSVSLNRSTMALAVGGTASLTASIVPSSASNTGLLWSTSNAGVATVSGGVVTGVAAGTATITVTTADGGKTASCEVTVSENYVGDSNFSILNASGTAIGGADTLVEAISAITDNGMKIVLNKDVSTRQTTAASTYSVTLDLNGYSLSAGLTASTEINLTIDGTSGGTISSTTTDTIELSAGTLSLQNVRLSVSASNCDCVFQTGGTLESVNGCTFTVTGSGKSGIYCKSGTIGTISGSTFTVNSSCNNTTVYQAGIIISTGATADTISDCTISTTTTVGAAMGINVLGSLDIVENCDITAASPAGQLGIGLFVNDTTIGSIIGGTYTVVNESNNKRGITIAGGVVEPINIESCVNFKTDTPCTITIASGMFDQAYGSDWYTCVKSFIHSESAYEQSGNVFTVAPVSNVAVTDITLNKTAITLSNGGTETILATVVPSDATNQNISWSSSNTSVATVSGGVVTAVGYGTAVITARSNNGITKTCTVTVLRNVTVSAVVHYNYTDAGTISGGKTCLSGESVTLMATENAGYVFDRWVNADAQLVSTEKSYTFTASEDIVLYAMYRIVHDPIVTVDVLKARGSVNGLANSYEVGATVTLTATAKSGHAFVGWFIGGQLVNSNATYTFTAQSDVRIYAKFS